MTRLASMGGAGQGEANTPRVDKPAWGSLAARQLLRPEGLERIAQVRPGRNAELGEGSVEVSGDGAVRQQ